MRTTDDDLTARARIRNAAVAEFGERGYQKATVRAIAARAGVSAGLVVHHFGSKEGLKHACDEHVLAVMASERGAVIAGGLAMPVADYWREHQELLGLTDYVYALLREGGESATRLFDQLCELTESMLAAGVAHGTIRPTDDERTRSATLVSMGVGFGLLSDHFARRVGGEDFSDPAVMEKYSQTVIDIYNHGLFAVEFSIPQGDS